MFSSLFGRKKEKDPEPPDTSVAPPAPAQPVDPYSVSDTTVSTAAATGDLNLDALLAGKNVFCEKSLVFKPEEVPALRALKAGSDAMWLSVFERLITRPDRRFAWDLTVQTFDAVSGDAPQEVLESAGRIGRTILSSVWALRHQQPWADALGASWATRLVVRTYCTDPERSRALLRAILDSVGDKTLSVEYVRHIVSHVVASRRPAAFTILFCRYSLLPQFSLWQHLAFR